MPKSSVAEIRARFDDDVARFSNLETGQQATMDAPLIMELLTEAAHQTNPKAKNILDIGCGAGNNTLKLLQKNPELNCDLVDLSQPMLDKALERIGPATSGQVQIFQSDIRTADLPSEKYDIILAAAVLHHLRDDWDWRLVFEKIYDLTAPGGSVWISDLISQETAPIQDLTQRQYGEYLTNLKGPEYRDTVFQYIEKEDSPRPVTFQLDLLRQVGFDYVEILHKNACFAAFGAVKSKY